jgi:hypothetical protein
MRLDSNFTINNHLPLARAGAAFEAADVRNKRKASVAGGFRTRGSQDPIVQGRAEINNVNNRITATLLKHGPSSAQLACRIESAVDS